MIIEMILNISKYIIVIISAVILHEIIHYFFALLFRRGPTIKMKNLITPTISYKNNQSDIQNLVIASSAPLILIFIGILVDNDTDVLLIFKLMCLANIFNLLPFTVDGQVILLSLFNILRKIVTND